jgi:hypothetical protein
MAIDPEPKEMLTRWSLSRAVALQSVEIVLLAKFESVLNRRKSTRPAAYKAFSESMEAFVKQVSLE